MLRARKYKSLETKLGHKFKSQPLLERALTHSSVRGANGSAGPASKRTDNERLEFIGDRVLGLVIAERLIKDYPDDNEGDLARRFNRLVRGETCAKVGRDIDLGPHLILSDSEAESGGRDKSTILADAVEALLGAVFLDAGFDKARDVVVQLWSDQAEPVAHVAADPKSALQEWAQGKGLSLPKYKVVSRKGPDHAPHFTAEVSISGRPPAQGDGASKRAAEQAAATALLAQEGVRSTRHNA